MHLGNFDRALLHAQRVNPPNVSGWYALGYRWLASAVESQARISTELQHAERLELLRYFNPHRFSIESPTLAPVRVKNQR